jgi:hypothetical protein
MRTPIEGLLADLSSLMDEADDIVRSNHIWPGQQEAARTLKSKFHGIRRKFARKLTDCDRSDRVKGNYWAALEQMDMDRAAESLEKAAVSPTLTALREDLLSFARAINAFSERLKDQLDKYAASLV